MATENDRYEDEFDEENEDNYQQEQGDYIELYSKWSIWGFCLFFASIFGAALLIRNLLVSGYKKAAYGITLFAIIYFIGSALALVYFKNQYLVIVSNLIAGLLYGNLFYNRYFPEDDYYPKSIWGALAISVIITLGLLLITQLIPGIQNQLPRQ